MSRSRLLRSAVLVLSVVLTATDEQDNRRELDNVMARRHQVLLSAKPIIPPAPVPAVHQAAIFEPGPPAQVPTREQLRSFPGPPAIRPFNELKTEEERLAFREHVDRLALQAKRTQALSRQREEQLRRN